MTIKLTIKDATCAIRAARKSEHCRALEPRRSPERRIRPELARDPSLFPRSLVDAFRWCRIGSMPWPLLITGAVGTGKSRFALSVHDWFGGRYVEWPEFTAEYAACRCGELRDYRYESEPIMREPAWISRLAESRLVILDDIGQRQVESDTSCEALKRLLDVRECWPLVLISNRTVRELAELFGDAVASRMCAGSRVHVDGVDMRLHIHDQGTKP